MENIKVDFSRDNDGVENNSSVDISIKSTVNGKTKDDMHETEKNNGGVKLQLCCSSYWKQFFNNVVSFSSILFLSSVLCVYFLLNEKELGRIVKIELFLLALVSLLSSVYVYLRTMDSKWYKKPFIKNIIENYNNKELDDEALKVFKELLDL